MHLLLHTAKYQLEILQKEKVTQLDKFVVTVPASPKRAYNLAKDITVYEQNNYFLEKDTLNLVHLYSGVDAEKLPPTYDFRVSQCGDMIYWNHPSVYDKFKNMLVNNMVFFGVENTDDKKIKINAELQPDKKNRAIENGVFNGFIPHFMSDLYNSCLATPQGGSGFTIGFSTVPTQKANSGVCFYLRVYSVNALE